MDPANLSGYAEASAEMFRFGVQGFTDDRLADGVGWVSFDVNQIKCPTVVLHGAADPIVVPSQAEHTASVVPGAELRMIPELGHFSISAQVVPVADGDVWLRLSQVGGSGSATPHRLPGSIGQGIARFDEISGTRRVRHPESGVLQRRPHPERLEHPG